MKRLLLFLASISFCFAQTITQSSTTTTTGDKTDLPNISTNPAIIWRLHVWATGSITSFTAQLDCAADNGSGGALSYSACAGAIDGTLNPATAVVASPFATNIALKLYTPHIAFNPTAIVGAGTLHWVLTGYFGANAPLSNVSTSGGGGGGGGAVTTACTAQAEVTLSGTSYNTIVAASGSTVISLCNIVVTSSSGGTPNVNSFSLAFGTCGSSPTEILNLGGVTGYTDQFLGSIAGAAGAALCFKESVGNGDHITVSYLQK